MSKIVAGNSDITVKGILDDNLVSTINGKLDGVRKINKKLGAGVFVTSLSASHMAGIEYIESIAKAGFEKVVICVHDRYEPFSEENPFDVNTSELKWYFAITVDELESLFNYAHRFGLAVSVKIHTKFANDIASGVIEETEIEDESIIRQHMENWMAHHLAYLKNLVKKDLDIEWISDFNESVANLAM